jgi:hypothetical protein
MKREARSGIVGLLVGLGVVAAPGLGEAVAVGACGRDLPGACRASVSLSGNTVTISLDNTSGAGGPYIVAELFRLGKKVTVYPGSFVSSDPDFEIRALPLGRRDTLIAFGSAPGAGIAPGESATFSFAIDDAAGLSEKKILKGSWITFGGSSRVDVDRPRLTRVAMPEPASLPLLALALGGLGLLWRRRRTT